jgi:CheY-like chemotaxis protein
LAEGCNDPDLSPLEGAILRIDDDDSILRLEKALLERSGYKVLTAASAQEGLKLVKTCMCDAVLLDYQMPGMNGREVASEIRLVRPSLAIILLSGSEVPTQALALVDAFVPKVDSCHQLLPVIADLCSRRQKANRKQEQNGI